MMTNLELLLNANCALLGFVPQSNLRKNELFVQAQNIRKEMPYEALIIVK